MGFFEFHGIIAGIFILVTLSIFPRLTMLAMLLFGSLFSGGCIWWIGFVFFPYVVVAYEATNTYWTTNPVLCIIAWLIAFCGTFSESRYVTKKRK